MPAVLNILLALRQRERSGQGCHLDIAMADAMPAFAWYGLAQGQARGRYPEGGEGLLTGASPRYGLYADARWLVPGGRRARAEILGRVLRGDRAGRRPCATMPRDPEATQAAIAAIIAAGRPRIGARCWSRAIAAARWCARWTRRWPTRT